MKKSILFFAALAALFSCSKENPVDNYNPADDTYSVTLTASAPGADTKTTLVDGDNNKFVHWSNGDAIKVLFFPHCISNDLYSGPSGVFYSHFDDSHSKEASFRIEGWSWKSGSLDLSGTGLLADYGIAVYPHTATAVSGKILGFKPNSVVTEVSFLLPSLQNAVNGNIESGLNFSYASVDKSSMIKTINYGSETKLSFKNACAMIELTMPNSFGGKKVTSISIISNDNVPLAGKGKVNMLNWNDYGTQNIVPDPLSVTITDASNVTLTRSTGFDAGETYYAVVWPGSHPSGLTIEFEAEDGSIATKTTKKVELTASRIKPYNFVSEMEFKDPILANPPKVGDFFYANGTFSTDLDNSKTVVGVVFFVGDPTEDDSTLKRDYPGCTHGLVVGLKAGNANWLSAKNKVYEWANANGYHTTQQFTYSSRLGENDNAKRMWGYNNTCAIREYAKANGLTSGIVNFADSYGVTVSNVSPWYIPSVAEMKIIRQGSFKSIVESLGGDSLSKQNYYTSSEENDNQYVPYVIYNTGEFKDKYKTTTDNVFAIFAF